MFIPNRFHDHLDACSRCANNPFNLCEEGARILEQEVQEIGSGLTFADLDSNKKKQRH